MHTPLLRNEICRYNAGNGTTSSPEAEEESARAEADAQAQSSGQQKQDQSSSSNSKRGKQKEKSKTSDKDTKSSKGKDNGKRKGRNKDFEDLKSKLPPDLKTFDFNDFQDMDALKAKLDELKLSKEGMAAASIVLACCMLRVQ